MSPDAVKAMLVPHVAELKNGGIRRLAIFGSVARDQAGERSDVELLTDFDRNKRLTAFD